MPSRARNGHRPRNANVETWNGVSSIADGITRWSDAGRPIGRGGRAVPGRRLHVASIPAPNMQVATQDIRDGQVVAALLEPFHATVWEIVRRHRGPATVADVASRTGRGVPDSQRALDTLVDARLMQRVPGRGSRRAAGYEVAESSILVIGFDPRDDGDNGRLRKFADRYAEHARGIIDGARAARAADGEWMLDLFFPVRLDPVEQAELRRRIEDLQDFLCNIQAKPAAEGAPDAHRCNYQLVLQAHPTRSPVLPLPMFHFVQRSHAHEAIARFRSAHMRGLSPRERQVALELIKGRTRPEVATQLGISTNTVATICKRLYAKLGIRTRTQLAARLRGGPGG